LLTSSNDTIFRPATENDIKGITEIYNHYILNSNTTEDQVSIEECVIRRFMQASKAEKLPVIVAVKGQMPAQSEETATGKKDSVPRSEKIIGFGFAETFNYGMTGLRGGRSRFTANIQFYVHSEYTRKRVGQSLLDRLIQLCHHGYG